MPNPRLWLLQQHQEDGCDDGRTSEERFMGLKPFEQACKHNPRLDHAERCGRGQKLG